MKPRETKREKEKNKTLQNFKTFRESWLSQGSRFFCARLAVVGFFKLA